MKIDIKTIATYATIFITIGITWGMFSERLDAVEKKADTIAEIKSDIAVIKEKIMWTEKYLITTESKHGNKRF